MARLHLYTFEDSHGQEYTYTTTNPRKAEEHGKRFRLRVIDNTYEWNKSELAADFTKDTEPGPKRERTTTP